MGNRHSPPHKPCTREHPKPLHSLLLPPTPSSCMRLLSLSRHSLNSRHSRPQMPFPGSSSSSSSSSKPHLLRLGPPPDSASPASAANGSPGPGISDSSKPSDLPAAVWGSGAGQLGSSDRLYSSCSSIHPDPGKAHPYTPPLPSYCQPSAPVFLASLSLPCTLLRHC